MLPARAPRWAHTCGHPGRESCGHGWGSCLHNSRWATRAQPGGAPSDHLVTRMPQEPPVPPASPGQDSGGWREGVRKGMWGDTAGAGPAWLPGSGTLPGGANPNLSSFMEKGPAVSQLLSPRVACVSTLRGACSRLQKAAVTGQGKPPRARTRWALSLCFHEGLCVLAFSCSGQWCFTSSLNHFYRWDSPEIMRALGKLFWGRL